MRLATDNHYSPDIAERLRDLGHDAVAAIEQGWHRDDDETLLARCTDERRALLTNNVGDFSVIVRTWGVQRRSHAGLVFTSDASMPRYRKTIGRYVEALDALLRAYPAGDELRDRIHWL